MLSRFLCFILFIAIIVVDPGKKQLRPPNLAHLEDEQEGKKMKYEELMRRTIWNLGNYREFLDSYITISDYVVGDFLVNVLGVSPQKIKYRAPGTLPAGEWVKLQECPLKTRAWIRESFPPAEDPSIFLFIRRVGCLACMEEDSELFLRLKNFYGDRVMALAPGTLGMKEQVEIFGRVKYLISYTWPALSNMIFLPDRATVIEVGGGKEYKKDAAIFNLAYNSYCLSPNKESEIFIPCLQ